MWTNPYKKIFNFYWEYLEIICRNKSRLEVFFRTIAHIFALTLLKCSGEQKGTLFKTWDKDFMLIEMLKPTLL